MTVLLDRAQMSTASINDLPDSAFAYIEPGGKKDSSGKTVPRSKRHFPLHDEEHVRNALSRAPQSPFGDKAMPKIRAAAKRYGIQMQMNSRPDLGLCVRSFGFEFEQRSDGRTLEGYAAVFDTPATIRDVNGDFEETILPRAFKRSLDLRTPILQWDHGKDPRIGTAPIGAIEELSEDTKGLHVRARLFDHPDIERVRLAIEAQAVKGMSFRFSVPDGGDEWPTRDQRHIRDADVHELGPVAFPAYDTTSVTVRSLLAQLDPDEHRALIRELAAELRLAADLQDLVGRPDARSAGGDEPGTEPGKSPAPPQAHLRQRLDEGALRARGILK
jgi:HK97 family phage prohead protease